MVVVLVDAWNLVGMGFGLLDFLLLAILSHPLQDTFSYVSQSLTLFPNYITLQLTQSISSKIKCAWEIVVGMA